METGPRGIVDFSKSGDQTSRLDVWLYRARFFKTRTLATKTVQKGRIRLTRNGKTERINKPHLLVRPGDQLTFMRGKTLFHVEMLAPGTRRGPAGEAQTLYRRIETD